MNIISILANWLIKVRLRYSENPIWHIHSGVPDQAGLPVSFTLLLNLAAVCHAEDPQIVWAYVNDYVGEISPKTHGEMDRMIGYAVNYYQDMVRP